MNLLDYSQFGVAIFSIAALTFCIKKFLEFMKHQEDNFTNVISNHLTEAARISKQQEESARALQDTVEELLQFLRYHNGKSQDKGR